MRLLRNAVVVVCALLLATAGPAAAHAALISTSPSNNQILARAPSDLRLTFNETVFRANVVMFAPDGSKVSVTDVRSVNAVVSARVKPPNQRGRWTFAYRVVSADGHPVTASITFTTTKGQPVKQVTPTTPKPSFVHVHRTHLIWVGLALVVGTALILVPIARRTRQN